MIPCTKILVEVNKTFGIKAMSCTQVYQIIKDVREEKDMIDRRGQTSSKTIRTPELIESVCKYVMSNGWMTYADIEEGLGLSTEIVNNIITKDLCLVKKSARWVPRLLDEGKKNKSGFEHGLCPPCGIGS